MISDQLVSAKVAHLAKECGFGKNEKWYHYPNFTHTPTQNALVSWFRDEYFIEVSASCYYYPLYYGSFKLIGKTHNTGGVGPNDMENCIMWQERTFESYEAELQASLINALEYLQNNILKLKP